MSNPTTPFSWQMPTATDLVTDLPADFEVFGQAVATSMADLLGGTTGQILAKNSATDMDFVWIANDQGDITGITATSPLTGGGTSGAITVGIQDASTSQKGSVQLSDSTSTTSSVLAATPTAVKSSYDLAAAAVPKSTATAKGSIFTATASATPAELAVGSNGSTLVADSAATTGLRYSATPSASNPIINSAFQIWQRGTSVAGSASTSNYTADRWLGYTAATSTFSRQATGDTTNLPNIQYAMRVQRTAGGTGTDHFYLTYSQESVNSIPYAGKSVTISFYARKGANFNDNTSGLTLVVGTGTGTDQNFLSGYTGSVTALNQALTLTTTWVRYSYNLNIGATATELGFYFNHRASATAAGAADYYEVTGVQIDVGSVALPFRTYAATIQGELAACQRYYWRTNCGEPYSPYGGGNAKTTTIQIPTIIFPVIMRTKPSAVDYNALLVLTPGVSGVAVTALTQAEGNIKSSFLNVTVASGLTANVFYVLSADGTSNGYLGFSSEL